MCRRCSALPGVYCMMPVLATAHYYSRYEFEVSQRVPKVIMGRHQRWPLLFVAPGLPCGRMMTMERTAASRPLHAVDGLCRPCRWSSGWICVRGGSLGGTGTPWSLEIKVRVLVVVPSPVPSHSCSSHLVMLHINPSFHGSSRTARAVLQQGPGYLLG